MFQVLLRGAFPFIRGVVFPFQARRTIIKSASRLHPNERGTAHLPRWFSRVKVHHVSARVKWQVSRTTFQVFCVGGSGKRLRNWQVSTYRRDVGDLVASNGGRIYSPFANPFTGAARGRLFKLVDPRVNVRGFNYGVRFRSQFARAIFRPPSRIVVPEYFQDVQLGRRGVVGAFHDDKGSQRWWRGECGGCDVWSFIRDGGLHYVEVIGTGVHCGLRGGTSE